MTDERVDEALRRAEEKALQYEVEDVYLAGWAKAIQALEYFHNHLHGGTSSLNCNDALGCPAKPVVNSFIRTMLRGSNG